MDQFRRIQKLDCLNGGSRKLIYGCPCCRKIRNLNKFKKVSRKMARHRLCQKDIKELSE